MFPEAARVVRTVRPKVFIFENVRGLLRRSFAKYFEYVILQLTYPEIVSVKEENWIEHLSRLERHHTKGENRGLHYRVTFRLVNAADYGVAQKRERWFPLRHRRTLELSASNTFGRRTAFFAVGH